MSARRRVTLAAVAVSVVCMFFVLAFASFADAYKAHVFSQTFGWDVNKTMVEDGAGQAERDVCTAASGDVCQAGAGGALAGQLALTSFVFPNEKTFASGVAVDDLSGDVFVADTGNRRVDEFSEQGVFLRAWGWGVADGEDKLESCTSECKAGVANAADEPDRFAAPNFIAVDNSPGSEGDVYVGDSGSDTVFKFTSAGTLVSSWGDEGHLRETPEHATFGEALAGVAVDDQGNLWVAAVAGPPDGGAPDLFEFAASGGFAHSCVGRGGVVPVGLAVDASGALYFAGGLGMAKFTSACGEVGQIENSLGHGGAITGLAVDQVAGDPGVNGLYVDSNGPEGAEGVEVRHFAASCEPALGLCAPVDSFGQGFLVEGQGLAVGPSEAVYVADAGQQRVVVFRSVILPSVRTGGVEDLAGSSVVLTGGVEPEGVALTKCVFEYGEGSAYGQQALCEYEYEKGRWTTDPAQIPTGAGEVQVRAEVSGLGSAFYQFRLAASNENGVEHGRVGSIGASVNSAELVSVGFEEAKVAGSVDPDGFATTCALQYVSEAAYSEHGFAGAAQAPCAPADLGSGEGDVSVEASWGGLDPGVSYRYRLVALAGGQGGHASDGPEGVLHTYETFVSEGCPNEALRLENRSLELPDCRAYELVSPPNEGEVYVPAPPFVLSGEVGAGVSGAEQPMLAAADGGAVAYAGEVQASGVGPGTGNRGGGEGDEHLAVRGVQGWQTRDVEPMGSGSETGFEWFTANLSVGFLKTGRPESLPAPLLAECLYALDGESGALAPLTAGECGDPVFVDATADGSGVLFESSAALVSGAAVAPGKGHDNVYYAAGGKLGLVNVLPGGAALSADPDASAGALSGEPEVALRSSSWPAVDGYRALAGDGGRAFWTDLTSGVVYVRVNPGQPQSPLNASGVCTDPGEACTLQVSAGAATYWAASQDGRYAYYTENGELWRFDVETQQRQALAGAGAGVQGVIGVNEVGEEGEYVYFVAQGPLASGAEARVCSPGGTGLEAEGLLPAGRGCNLYVDHDGTISLVAALLAGDDDFAGNTIGTAQPAHGVWAPVLGDRAAQITPDGRTLVFMSERRLTGYDNVNSKAECGGNVHACAEVYVYDAPTGRLACASCDPSGVSPEGAIQSGQRGEATFLPMAFTSITYTPRAISRDGERVFFNTAENMLPAGTGGHEGVYEWEQEGSGSCTPGAGSPLDGGGCVYLLSGQTKSAAAFLLATNEGEEGQEGGENAFFITRSQLIPADDDEEPSLYDARVDGGFPFVRASSESSCASAQECRQPPSVSPVVFPALFSGPGNVLGVPAAAPAAGGVQAEKAAVAKHAPSRAQLLARALAACRRERAKRKRAACEQVARRRYGTAQKRTKKRAGRRAPGNGSARA